MCKPWKMNGAKGRARPLSELRRLDGVSDELSLAVALEDEAFAAELAGAGDAGSGDHAEGFGGAVGGSGGVPDVAEGDFVVAGAQA